MPDILIDSAHIRLEPGTLWLLNLSLSLVMFGIALEITFEDFRRLYRHPRPVITGILSQFLLLPLLTFILVVALKPYPSLALGMFMVAACPGGNVSNFISQLAGGNTALSVSLTAIATILALVFTPLNLGFWGSLYPPTAKIMEEIVIDHWAMVRLVGLLIGLPLILGMIVRAKWPNTAASVAVYFRKGSLLFFIMLIFLALYDNMEVFKVYVWYVFWLVVLHNLMAILTGYSFAWLLGNSVRDIRSIAIETGIQNSGLGLLLIFTFFEELGGMALLAAFWGIWHLVSGLLLAGFWGYLPIAKKEVV